ncbi:MAG: elongation factor P [Planctomycetaceae bacterium]|jgi:elongation factor P|nr:elongation factor P [Planctomycetaceae bacterium]
MKATDLRPGYGVKMDGKLFVITNFEHRTPGNLRAFIQIKIRNVTTGQIIEKRLSSSDDVEVIDLDRRPMQYLYKEGQGAVFMDNETFDQITMPEGVLGDALMYLRENAECVVMIYDNRPILIELPGSVELKVTETTPPMSQKVTATNVQKEATLETGLKTRLPDFIKEGETVRISTSDGSYQSRA